VISTLPGHNFGEESPIDNRVPATWLTSPTGGVVAEGKLAYNPRETPLLEQIRAERHRGWIAVDGLQILLEQGAPQFELFTGRKAPRQVMKAGAARGHEEQRSGD